MKGFAKIAALAFMTGFSGAVMPGPFLVKVIEQTPIIGFKAPMLMMIGHSILELIIVIILMLGFRSLIARASVRAFIGIVGGAVLLWMSYDMMRNGWHMRLMLDGKNAVAYSWPELLLLGAGVSIVNPYFAGWWAMIGLGGMAQMRARTKGDYLSFYFGHEAADYAWYGAVGLVLVTSRRWLTDGIYRWLIVTCGAILFVLAVWFLWTGFRLLKTGGGASPNPQRR